MIDGQAEKRKCAHSPENSLLSEAALLLIRFLMGGGRASAPGSWASAQPAVSPRPLLLPEGCIPLGAGEALKTPGCCAAFWRRSRIKKGIYPLLELLWHDLQALSSAMKDWSRFQPFKYNYPAPPFRFCQSIINTRDPGHPVILPLHQGPLERLLCPDPGPAAWAELVKPCSHPHPCRKFHH